MKKIRTEITTESKIKLKTFVLKLELKLTLKLKTKFKFKTYLNFDSKFSCQFSLNLNFSQL